VIIEFSESSANASVANYCFQLLNSDETLMPVYNNNFLTEELFDRVGVIMGEHENEAQLQKSAMEFEFTCTDTVPESAFWFLVWDTGDSSYLIAVRQALYRHSNDAALQALGLQVLRGHAYHVVIHRWPLTLITTAMRNHPLDAQVQKTACALFTDLMECRDEEEDEEHVFDTLSDKEYICAALAAVTNHPGNGSVRFESFQFLSKFSIFTGNDPATAYSNMVKCGAVELILGVEAVQSIWQSCAISVLASLINTSAEARSRAIENDVVSVLIESLKNPFLFANENDSLIRTRHVHREARSAFNNLLINDTNDALGSQIANEGGLKLLIQGILEDQRPLDYAQKRCLCKTSETCRHHNQNAPAARSGRLEEYGGKSRHESTCNDGTLKVYPEAAYVRDSRDRLPLHLAIRAKAPLSMVQLLLDANQASGEANYRYKNEFLNFPPALIASASECDLDVVFTLLRFVPSIAKPLGGGETSISTTTKRKRS
jgi:hypothetical protein